MPDDAYSRDRQLRAVGTAFLKKRPLLVAPFMLFTLAVFVASDVPRREVVVLAAAMACFLAFFSYEAWTGRTKLIGVADLRRSLLLTIAGLFAGSFVTGGIESPLLPMLFAPFGVGLAAFGRGRSSAYVLGALLAAIAALFALGPWAPFGPIPKGAHTLVLFGAFVDAALLLAVGISSLSDAHAAGARSLASAGQEILSATRSRAEALEALGAKVAHEVKNPLAAIRALVEVMREGAEGRDKKRLDVASSEVGRIEAILEGYLSFAKPFADLAPARVDVADVLAGLVAILEPRATEGGVTLVASGAPAEAVIDVDRIKEAVLNLLVNAIAVTPRGGHVTLAWKMQDRGLTIEVVDTGRGMDEKALARVGTPGFTERAGGSGLGVALARQAVEQHGGTLTYTSALGRGTTATITIPERP